MEPDTYRQMFQVESSHWWYVGLHELLARLIRRHCPPPARLLDVGSGTGRWLQVATHVGYRAIGVERDAQALNLAARRDVRGLHQGEAESLPVRDGTVDAVTCIDVLYHTGVESELQALCEIRRVLKPGGLAVLQLPAFEWLRSSHDNATHGCRRYRQHQVCALVREAGLRPIRVTYRNTFLFPLACAIRLLHKLARSPEDNHSDLRPPPALLNSLLLGVLRLENWLLAAGCPLPFGLSVIAVAQRPN